MDLPLLNIRTADDLVETIGQFGVSVSARASRTKEQKEAFCLRRYLLSMHSASLMRFPIVVFKSETPDFTISGAQDFGIEVVEATDELDQREYTLAERSNKSCWLDGDFGGQGKGGFVGREAERLWVSYIRAACTKKIGLPYSTTVTKVLIYSNSNAGGMIAAHRATALLSALCASNDNDWQRCRNLNEVSILKGQYLIHDVGRSPRLLPLYE